LSILPLQREINSASLPISSFAPFTDSAPPAKQNRFADQLSVKDFSLQLYLPENFKKYGFNSF
jgi:hypothetical protein